MIAIVAIPFVAMTLSVPGDAQVLAQYQASLHRYATLRAEAVAALPERQLCGGPEQLEIDHAQLASEIGHPNRARLSLTVNGETRQDTDIADMIFPVAEIITELSKLFELKSGDLIFTGTPAGVGPLLRGDRFRAELAGIAALEGRIA